MVVKSAEKMGVETEFRALARQWIDGCAFLSSTSAMVAHPAYQAIIDLGTPVVPLLLRELEKEPVHWFEALKAITGQDPVPAKDWGNIPAMASAWLEWGRSGKLI
jgi:hypothetical protein